MEEALHDIPVLRRFAGLDAGISRMVGTLILRQGRRQASRTVPTPVVWSGNNLPHHPFLSDRSIQAEPDVAIPAGCRHPDECKPPARLSNRLLGICGPHRSTRAIATRTGSPVRLDPKLRCNPRPNWCVDLPPTPSDPRGGCLKTCPLRNSCARDPRNCGEKRDGCAASAHCTDQGGGSPPCE